VLLDEKLNFVDELFSRTFCLSKRIENIETEIDMEIGNVQDVSIKKNCVFLFITSRRTSANTDPRNV